MSIERVCAVDDLIPGRAALAEVGGLKVAMVRLDDGSIHAVEDECSHGRVSLSEGEVSGCTLECWLHGSKFDLLTGAPITPPATAAIRVYPVTITDGDVHVDVAVATNV